MPTEPSVTRAWSVARRVGLALALLAAACGGAQEPAKGRLLPGGPRFERDLDPSEVFPADLDLVIRVDVGRMRAALGPTGAEALSKRALSSSGERELVEALGCAEVVWIG